MRIPEAYRIVLLSHFNSRSKVSSFLLLFQDRLLVLANTGPVTLLDPHLGLQLYLVC